MPVKKSKMDSDIITLDSVRYVSGTTIVGSVAYPPLFEHSRRVLTSSDARRVPVIVINSVGQRPTDPTWLQRRIMELESEDDVINTSFSKRVIVKVSVIEYADIQNQYSTSSVHIEKADITREFYSTSLRDGPYFLVGCDLYKAYRLYDDPYGAFVSGVYHPQEEPFMLSGNLSVQIQQFQSSSGPIIVHQLLY